MENEKKNKKRTVSLKKKIDFNIDFSFIKKKMKKNKTISTERNNNKKNLAYLRFKENLLIWLLKKSKYNNQRETPRRRKIKNFSIDNTHNKSQLSEKYKNIPGIDKLQYLTDQSINELLSRDTQSHFSGHINIFSNKELKKKISKYNSAFRATTKISLFEPKDDNNFEDKKTKDETISLALDSSNKIVQKSKNKIINNKLFYNQPKEKFIINNKSINHYIKDVNIYLTNKKININNNNNSVLYFKKNNNNINKCFKLYSKPNECSKKILFEENKNNTITLKKFKKKNNRILSAGISRRKAQTHQNLFEESIPYKTNTGKNKSYIINIDNNNNEMKKLNIKNIPKTRYLNRSSKVDRLLFKLENPNECFEDNVYSNRPEDKFISFKNQIAKQKNKTIKMFNDSKMALKLNETLMRRYVFKLFSDKNKNKINY